MISETEGLQGRDGHLVLVTAVGAAPAAVEGAGRRRLFLYRLDAIGQESGRAVEQPVEFRGRVLSFQSAGDGSAQLARKSLFILIGHRPFPIESSVCPRRRGGGRPGGVDGL